MPDFKRLLKKIFTVESEEEETVEDEFDDEEAYYEDEAPRKKKSIFKKPSFKFVRPAYDEEDDERSDEEEYNQYLEDMGSDAEEEDRPSSVRSIFSSNNRGKESYDEPVNKKSSNVVNFNERSGATGNSESRQKTSMVKQMTVTMLKTLADERFVVDTLLGGEPVIINISDMVSTSPENGQRVIDFISGAAYAISGSMEKLGENLYLVSPKSVDVTIDYGYNEDGTYKGSRYSYTRTEDSNN
ncbi:MAG TPA: hypothetical protein DEO62_06220 [Lachnospiraceae bacterium]|jgi:cell division inhibitor SepF|nr:hypothetical protein [Lachnospiraceae bacterium]HBR04422.1 hypothetical protein [Lachnospiraceae bacterium]HBZ90597.1 hypothetical protein [Lachnospiraceae bacterium]